MCERDPISEREHGTPLVCDAGTHTDKVINQLHENFKRTAPIFFFCILDNLLMSKKKGIKKRQMLNGVGRVAAAAAALAAGEK